MTVAEKLREALPKGIKNDDVFFICIGTDRSTGDALAPLVGTYLKRHGYENLVGTLEAPVHAMNLQEAIDNLPKDKIIIAIDACLGKLTSIGRIDVEAGPLKAGEGVGKNLPLVGDYSIKGIVNVGGFMEHFVLQNTRLSIVDSMALEIVEGICEMLPLKERSAITRVMSRLVTRMQRLYVRLVTTKVKYYI